MTAAFDEAKRPNFLVIIADDLGYSDTGAYGGEIHTPNITKLAKDGIRMTNFHTAAACSPTRAMVFSGTDNHIAGLGQMEEFMIPYREHFKDKPGYEGYLNWKVAALSEILQDNGYLNIMSGKWHLGSTKELAPCSRGFHKNFTLLPAACNHFAYEPQLDDTANFTGLRVNGHWMEGERLLDYKTDLPKEFYSSKSFTDKFIGFFEDRTADEKKKPFFGYLPFTAPHWPLQAPREYIQKYAGMYDSGPDELTKARLNNLIKLGLMDERVQPHPPVGRLGKSWDEMNDEERTYSARKMEIFAAMVEVMDENIGRVLDYFEATGELDNTFVLFMSDNGAEGASLEAIPLMGGKGTRALIFEKFYNNSLENMGNKDSFVWYGPRWACAGTAPSHGLKGYVHEGGIRCPCIVRYPPFSHKTGQNAITHAFTTAMDILPTILDLAGISHPGSTFRNRSVVPVRGKSWVQHLSGDLNKSDVHSDDVNIQGWEFLDQKAIRQGKWKAVWAIPFRGTGQWQLYNLAEDPGETRDCAKENPERLERLLLLWEEYFSEMGMIPCPIYHNRVMPS